MAIRIDLLDRTLAERSLADFVKQAWQVLEPRTAFQDNWHISLLSEYLEALAAGDIIRLIINVPPRSGKSLLATIFLPCWVWLHNPAERFMFASYSAALSIKHSLDRRTLIKSRWYQSRWAGIVKLADDLNLKTEFANIQRGHMIATSVGASATGRGGNFLLADDLINPQQANSDLEREAAIRWFDETYSTRLDDKRTGSMLVIEQRTNVADLTGHLLAQGGWTHVSLPAIAERKTTIVFPLSKKIVIREEGDLLWPAREGHAELEAVKVRVGLFAFQSQYMQEPVSREGNLIKAEWLTSTYPSGGLPPRFDSIITSLDTAYKTGSSNDFSAIVVLGTLRSARNGYAPAHYLLEAWRGRVEFAELKRKVVAMQETWHANAVLIEDAASGQSLLQELRAGTMLPVKPIKPDRDKYSRAAAICPILEARRLILPEAAWWRDDFVAELISFPAGAFDDWVDALVQALNYLRETGGGTNFLNFLKLQTASNWVREGLSVDAAASRAGLSSAQLQHFMDLRNRPAQENPWLVSETVAAKPAPWSCEPLIAAHAAGHYIDINPDVYRGRVRNDLRAYAAAHPETPAPALALIATLDARFNSGK
jgi:predicted phage terminase large subunit-like protein